MGRIILPDSYRLSKGEVGYNPHNTLPVHVGMGGYYRAEVRKARTGKLKYDTGWFKNLITDQGLVIYWNLPRLGTFDSGQVAANCAVGTGNTTPLVTDVSLANLRATAPGTAGSGTGYPGPNTVGYVAAVVGPPAVPAYWYARFIYQFGTGAAAGNLTEVGTYPGGTSAASNLISRSLIVDDNGNPTSITVLSDEILTVTWELRWYVDTSDHAFNFNLNGARVDGIYSCYQGNQQRANTTSINGSLGEVDLYTATALVNRISGSLSGRVGFISNSQSPMSYIQFVNDLANSGTCYADVKGTFGTGNGTSNAIGAFSYQNHMWSYQFANLTQGGNPFLITKTAGQQLQVNFRQSWGRYTG